MRLFLIIATVLFLCSELALNAAILDLIDPDVNQASVDHVRDIAGYLGGFGIGLLLVRIFVMKGSNPDRISSAKLGATALIMIVSVLGVREVQRSVAEGLVSATDGVQRKDAMVVVGATYGLMSGIYRLGNLNIATDISADPTSRTGVILFSPLVIWGDALERVELQARKVIKNTLYQRSIQIKPNIENAIQTSCTTFNEKYAEYAAGAEDARRRYFPKRFQEEYEKVRDGALPLEYEKSLPLDLTKEQLLRHPDIQGHVRYEVFNAVSQYPLSSQVTALVSKQEIMNSLNHLFARKVIDPCMAWPVFRREYVGGMIKYVDSLVGSTINRSELTILEDGGRYQDLGRNAVFAALGPPVAFAWFLAVSLIGLAIIVSTVAVGLFRFGKVSTSLTVVAVLGIIATAPFSVSNSVVDSAAFQERAKAIEANIGTVPMKGFEWVLRTAPLIYPLSSWMRDYGPGVFLGINRR